MVPLVFRESVEIEFSRTLGTDSQDCYGHETGFGSRFETIRYPKDSLFTEVTHTELSSTEDCLISTIPSLKNPPNTMNIHESTKQPQRLRKWVLIFLVIFMILTIISLGIAQNIGYANNLEIMAQKMNTTMMELLKTRKEKEELANRISEIHRLSKQRA